MLILRYQCPDFQMAFKLRRINIQNNLLQMLKEMADKHRNKIELEKNI